MADRQIRGAMAYKTLADLALCRGAGRRRRAVAVHVPALARHRWRRGCAAIGIDWNPLLNGNHAMALVVMAAAWKQISYNFLFFLAGLQSIPQSVIEAAAIDGARPARRFWTIIFPLLSPTTFFLLVVNIIYVFFDTFGIIDAVTGGGPAKATETLVYKVFHDGRLGGDLGGSAAQSVILMVDRHRPDRDPVQLYRAQGALLMVENRRFGRLPRPCHPGDRRARSSPFRSISPSSPRPGTPATIINGQLPLCPGPYFSRELLSHRSSSARRARRASRSAR